MMIIELKGISIKNDDKFGLTALFYGSSEGILYKDYEFSKITLQGFDKSGFEKVSFFNPQEDLFITQIKEDEDADEFYLYLSNNDILRIYVTDVNGLSEKLSYEKFTQNTNDYYWTVRDWYEKALNLKLNK